LSNNASIVILPKPVTTQAIIVPEVANYLISSRGQSETLDVDQLNGDDDYASGGNGSVFGVNEKSQFL